MTPTAKSLEPLPSGLGSLFIYGVEMNCPKCGSDCWREEVDVGVGVIFGPYGCPECGWSEDTYYDLSEGQDPIDERGYHKDQWGGLTKVDPKLD